MRFAIAYNSNIADIEHPQPFVAIGRPTVRQIKTQFQDSAKPPQLDGGGRRMQRAVAVALVLFVTGGAPLRAADDLILAAHLACSHFGRKL